MLEIATSLSNDSKADRGSKYAEVASKWCVGSTGERVCGEIVRGEWVCVEVREYREALRTIKNL